MFSKIDDLNGLIACYKNVDCIRVKPGYCILENDYRIEVTEDSLMYLSIDLPPDQCEMPDTFYRILMCANENQSPTFFFNSFDTKPYLLANKYRYIINIGQIRNNEDGDILAYIIR